MRAKKNGMKRRKDKKGKIKRKEKKKDYGTGVIVASCQSV